MGFKIRWNLSNRKSHNVSGISDKWQRKSTQLSMWFQLYQQNHLINNWISPRSIQNSRQGKITYCLMFPSSSVEASSFTLLPSLIPSYYTRAVYVIPLHSLVTVQRWRSVVFVRESTLILSTTFPDILTIACCQAFSPAALQNIGNENTRDVLHPPPWTS